MKNQFKPGDILINRDWLNSINSDWPKEYVEIGRYLILSREVKILDGAMANEPEVQFRTILLYVHPNIAGAGIMPPDHYILAENELDYGHWEIQSL